MDAPDALPLDEATQIPTAILARGHEIVTFWREWHAQFPDDSPDLFLRFYPDFDDPSPASKE